MFTVKNLTMVAASGAALLVGLGDIKQASAVIIGFDDLGTQGDTFGAFESQGLSFSTPSDTFRLGVTCGTCSQPNSLGADGIVDGEPLEFSFTGAIVAQFTNNRFATDLQFTALNRSDNTVTAFDNRGSLLRTFTSDDAVDLADDQQGETFDLSGLKVARFETNSPIGYAIDDVSFGKPVPEPSEILGTIAFGVLGGGLMLKRKLKKQKSVSFNKISS